MPTIEYSNNPNSETVFVTDGGKRTRALKQVLVDGTIDYPQNANSKDCYVTVDGKKQRALMTVDIASEGTLEYPDGSNSTKGYVTDGNGNKHRVILTAALAGGGSAPVIEELNVTPSTSAQTITAPEGTDGYSPVNVSAVTSSIDANITAGNIKKDVTILGITGSYEGVAPSGTKTITSNGTHDVAGYANADVQVPTTAPQRYLEFSVDNSGNLQHSKTATTFIDLSGVKNITITALQGSYQQNTALTGAIDMSSIESIQTADACRSMLAGCTNITSADLSNLERITSKDACNSMFNGCTGLTSFNLSKLKQIGDYSITTSAKWMFQSCSGLTSADLSNLETVGKNACQAMFQYCSNLSSVNLSKLNKIYYGGCGYMFVGCTSLTSLSFPALKSTSFGSDTTQFDNMLQNVTGCTVHFPSNLQSVIGSWSSVTGGFGGTNTTVLFDLPATA